MMKRNNIVPGKKVVILVYAGSTLQKKNIKGQISMLHQFIIIVTSFALGGISYNTTKYFLCFQEFESGGWCELWSQ